MDNAIPKTWSVAALWELGTLNGGGTPSKTVDHYWNGDIPWVSPKDMKQDAIFDSEDHITEHALNNSATKLIPSNSVLLVTRSGILAHTFPVAITMVPVTVNQDLKALTPFDGIEAKYLAWLLRANAKRILETCTKDGTTVNSIETSRLKDLSVPIAPHMEQLRIVAKIEMLFSELDKGIESLKTAQAQLKVYRQALLKHAFEGNLTAEWREKNPDKVKTADTLLKHIQSQRTQRYQQQTAEWETGGKQWSKPKVAKPQPSLTQEELASLSTLPPGWTWTRFGLLDIDLKRGPFGSAITKSMFVPNGFKIYEQGNAIYRDADRGKYFISQDKYEELGGFAVSPGDFIVSCAGTVGRIFELPKQAPPGIINQALMRVRINETILSKRFFAILFESGHFQRKVLSDAKGTAMVNLAGIKELNLVPVAICGLDEQRAVEELLELRLSEVEQLDRSIIKSLKQCEALRYSILEKAFLGQLVPQEPHDEPASILLKRIKVENFAQLKGKKAQK